MKEKTHVDQQSAAAAQRRSRKKTPKTGSASLCVEKNIPPRASLVNNKETNTVNFIIFI
jgi:hypothetical protein